MDFTSKIIVERTTIAQRASVKEQGKNNHCTEGIEYYVKVHGKGKSNHHTESIRVSNSRFFVLNFAFLKGKLF